MREANTKDLSLLLLLGVIWGSSFFNIKIATYSYEPFTLALVRVIFASIPLFLLCKFQKIKIEAFSNNWVWYALIGLCNIAIPFVLIAIGTAKINSYLAAILMSTTPLSGSILAHIFIKDETRGNILIKYVLSEKCRAKVIEKIMETLYTDFLENNDTCIIVTKEKVTYKGSLETFINKIYKENKQFGQIFSISDFLYDITEHELCPKYQILTEEEKEEVVEACIWIR